MKKKQRRRQQAPRNQKRRKKYMKYESKRNKIWIQTRARERRTFISFFFSIIIYFLFQFSTWISIQLLVAFQTYSEIVLRYRFTETLVVQINWKPSPLRRRSGAIHRGPLKCLFIYEKKVFFLAQFSEIGSWNLFAIWSIGRDYCFHLFTAMRKNSYYSAQNKWNSVRFFVWKTHSILLIRK